MQDFGVIKSSTKNEFKFYKKCVNICDSVRDHSSLLLF